MTPYSGANGKFILQNDEDTDPKTPAEIRYPPGRRGVGLEASRATPLGASPSTRSAGHVVKAARQGCDAADYPGSSVGEDHRRPHAVPGGSTTARGGNRSATRAGSARRAQAAGAIAIVHDFVAKNSSPVVEFDLAPGRTSQCSCTKHRTARGMVEAGWARLKQGAHP